MQTHLRAEHRKRLADALVRERGDLGHRERGKVKLSSSKEARRAPEQFFPQAMMLEGPSWEALRLFMCVPEILHMRVVAQEFNDTKKYCLCVSLLSS